MNRRYDQLDSLRGLAASSVLLSHLIFPSFYLIDKIKNTPLHIFWAGHEAVILFFLLSGFVLSLPFHNNKKTRYRDYLVKRICRIYIPYIASIILSILLMTTLAHTSIPELGNWFNGNRISSLSSESLIGHFLFLGDYNSTEINPVVWSLVHEMRISLIFPLLMFFVIRLGWKKNIALSLACTVIYYLCIKTINYNIPFIYSIHYIGFFTVGALLAKHRQFIHDLYLKLTNSLKYTIMIVGVMAYTYTYWFFPNSAYLHVTLINDWVVAIGSCIFIIFSLNSNILKKILLLKPIHFIGQTSYSLYLFHIPLLLTLFNIFYEKMPIWLIAVIAFVFSYIFAGITYYLIEKPSIKLGGILTTRFKKISVSSESSEAVKQKYSLKV
ncbi:acyltransferase [Paenibacillus sp. LjRoot153]|uniref:acyltransferase family protein n=1 Tax=Paenibacillus sp. LjRoot153 TaxID=3342270 RepID=UPI003ECFEB5D